MKYYILPLILVATLVFGGVATATSITLTSTSTDTVGNHITKSNNNFTNLNNGKLEYPSSSSAVDNSMLIFNGTSWQSSTLPYCTSSQKPVYTSSTHSWSCATDQTGAGAVTVNTAPTSSIAYYSAADTINGSTTFGFGVAFTTLDTGQGANELYDMDQNVLKASAVEFADISSTNSTSSNVSVRTQLRLVGETALRLLQVAASGIVSSVSDLTSWIAGTSNEITVANDGDGTVTVSLPATIDLGGKTSFEIPNGTGPTVDTIGEIAIDTSANQFVYYASGTDNIIDPIYELPTKTILNPTSSKQYSIWRIPANTTINRFYCGSDTVSAAMNLTLWYRAYGSQTTSTMTTAMPCGAADYSTTTFAVNFPSSTQIIGITTGSASGTPTSIWFSAETRRTRQ